MFVEKEYRKKGLASVMMHMLSDLAFNQLRLHRLSTVYRAGNEASEKLLSMSGFKKEGTIRDGWYGNGLHHDIIQVGLLKSDWLEKREKINERLSASLFAW
jgi:RimJ/RimL family protein N-acetyltransferase